MTFVHPLSSKARCKLACSRFVKRRARRGGPVSFACLYRCQAPGRTEWGTLLLSRGVDHAGIKQTGLLLHIGPFTETTLTSIHSSLKYISDSWWGGGGLFYKATLLWIQIVAHSKDTSSRLLCIHLCFTANIYSAITMQQICGSS